MIIRSEAEFERKIIKILQDRGWERNVLKNPTEKDLLDNWAQILFTNNRQIDKLNNVPLTSGEMQQIMEQIIALRTPMKLNRFINGKSIQITRDNPNDKLHLGKVVSLDIYDRKQIAAGQSRYQIVQQPIFKAGSRIMHDRRGDLMLLINGMPVIHIELKNTGIPVSQACNQIQKYSDEGLFSGIFSLIQIFVAMTPDETKYFANPGPDGLFNPDFYFNWANFNNEPVNKWADVTVRLLSIPMAHQMIGFYTVADASDGVLKVMRSYQYYAAHAISDRVAKTNWKERERKGGYIWHTTGSGKTMTSFKSAQLIAGSNDADKVIFLMDRIELGTQSLRAYRAFADDREVINDTEDTYELINKLKSNDHTETLIVTSIQKMSNIKQEENGLNEADIEAMSSKRIVFIIDEAHRSTFGEMLITIKNTFPDALFFGFTGTPILDENEKKDNTTATVFGDELHRYSIADGIRDKNVLGFDAYKVMTYQNNDLRKAVALQEAKASDIADALSDPRKASVYNHYMNTKSVEMTGQYQKDGSYNKGIEDYVPRAQYEQEEHRQLVVKDILDNWVQYSDNYRFHALFATSSIAEAIEYYRLFKASNSDLKITALFDPSIDNHGSVQFKTEGLYEIIDDYNKLYDQDFTMASHANFKKDVAARLAHKSPYLRVEHTPELQLDLLIVVDQMLTGYDSKWVNTLYLDKVLRYESVIQAFSRTNRLHGNRKPHGTIRYYRYPNTMEKNIEHAVKLYSGDRPLGLFVERLDQNLEEMNKIYSDISRLFTRAGIPDFSRLPEDITESAQFAKLFNDFDDHLEAAKIQGFIWNKQVYEFESLDKIIEVMIDERTYHTLRQRYRELYGVVIDVEGGGDVPFDIKGHLTVSDPALIDYDYMNSRFEKYRKALEQPNISEETLRELLADLHSSFASLNQEDQRYADIFIRDVHTGSLILEEGKEFTEYITEYKYSSKHAEVNKLSDALGLDTKLLLTFMNGDVTTNNIDDFGRFQRLKNTVDRDKAKAHFENATGSSISAFSLNREIDKILKDFILKGGFDIENEV